MRSFLRENLCSEPFPNFDGKFIQGGDSRNKRDARRASDSEVELLTSSVVRNLFYPAGKTRWPFCVWYWSNRSRTQERLRQRFRDERARSDLRLQISFRMKFRERELHREASPSEICGQCTRGGKPRRIMVETSRSELIANLPVKLLMEWFGRCAIQPDHFKSD